MASMTDVQVTSGKLKLKGGVSLGGKKRAKKKKKKRKKDHDDVISSSISSVTSNSLTSATKSSSSPSSKQNKRARTDDPSIKNDTRTAAEKKMDERLRIKVRQLLYFMFVSSVFFWLPEV
jgi:hypothetical protein